MSLPVTTVWEVRTTGDDTNGGGFSSARGGTDMTYGAGYAVLSLTDLACASNTTLTSATGGFTAAMVGNIIQIASGTNAAAGFYEVTAYTSTNQVTIDRTCASGGNMTDGVGKLGGALATPGKAGAGLAGGNVLWIKTGTYTITTANYNEAAGCLKPPAGSGNGNPGTATTIGGYGTTRGDGGRPTLKLNAGVTSANILRFESNTHTVRDLILDGNSQTSSVGMSYDSTARLAHLVYRVTAQNCTTGFNACYGTRAYCEAVACGTGFASASDSCLYRCVARECTTVGFRCDGMYLVECLAYDNTGDGFSSQNQGTALLGCTSCNPSGGDGFDFTSTGPLRGAILLDCLSAYNGAYDFTFESGRNGVIAARNGAYGGTSGTSWLSGQHEADITLTADPFVAKATDDYTPTTEARSQSFEFPGGQDSFPDIGAVRHPRPTLPAVGDVESGVTFGDGAALTGTFVVPAEEDVEDGVTYGAGGTEFEGTLAGGGGGGAIILSGMGQIGVSQS